MMHLTEDSRRRQTNLPTAALLPRDEKKSLPGGCAGGHPLFRVTVTYPIQMGLSVTRSERSESVNNTRFVCDRQRYITRIRPRSERAKRCGRPNCYERRDFSRRTTVGSLGSELGVTLRRWRGVVSVAPSSLQNRSISSNGKKPRVSSVA